MLQEVLLEGQAGRRHRDVASHTAVLSNFTRRYPTSEKVFERAAVGVN
jgi:hypothetical protein